MHEGEIKMFSYLWKWKENIKWIFVLDVFMKCVITKVVVIDCGNRFEFETFSSTNVRIKLCILINQNKKN